MLQSSTNSLTALHSVDLRSYSCFGLDFMWRIGNTFTDLVKALDEEGKSVLATNLSCVFRK